LPLAYNDGLGLQNNPAIWHQNYLGWDIGKMSTPLFHPSSWDSHL